MNHKKVSLFSKRWIQTVFYRISWVPFSTSTMIRNSKDTKISLSKSKSISNCTCPNKQLKSSYWISKFKKRDLIKGKYLVGHWSNHRIKTFLWRLLLGIKSIFKVKLMSCRILKWKLLILKILKDFLRIESQMYVTLATFV